MKTNKKSEKKDHQREKKNEREVYLKQLARKWEGSDPITAEAYTKAILQWKQLSGATVTTPFELAAINRNNAAKKSNTTPDSNTENKQEEGLTQ